MRTNKKYIEAVFDRLLNALGKRRATSYSDVGGWQLDHNSIYGGYNIEEIASTSGGVSQPFGPMRMKAGPFAEAMQFALRALEHKD